jgi:hypothetical protein
MKVWTIEWVCSLSKEPKEQRVACGVHALCQEFLFLVGGKEGTTSHTTCGYSAMR